MCQTQRPGDERDFAIESHSLARHQAVNFNACRRPAPRLSPGRSFGPARVIAGTMQTGFRRIGTTPCTVLGAIALAIASTAAFADDHPRGGKLYGTRDADFIEYFCSPLTAQTIECRFTKATVRKKAADGHTCFLWLNAYEQIFQRTGDAWVYTIEPEPTDNCGMAYVARFEKDLTTEHATFWRHKTRRSVTNKSASDPGLACSEINETEYTYHWEPKAVFKGCDYVTLD
jgi:hypothetical protein